MTLESPVTNIPLVGPSKALILEKLGIKTIKDLLFHIPFKYRDTSNVLTIAQLKVQREGTIIGKVEKIENIYTRYRKVFTRAKVTDESGSINLVWFHQTYLAKAIKQGELYLFEGKMSKKNNDFVSPTFEIYSGDLEEQQHIGKITPYYSETEGLTSKWIRARINSIKKNINEIFLKDLPNNILEQLGLHTLSHSITQVHFPKSFEDINEGRNRLAFDEMLSVSIQIQKSLNLLQGRKAPKIRFKKSDLDTFLKTLPYQLTLDQYKAVEEILNDLGNEVPMNRLLNGDVGSGKTIVSAIAMYIAYINGYSSVILAPTTILANQHFQTLKTLFDTFNIDVQLRVGNKKIEESNKPRIVIGTHALLYDKDDIKNLGLLIVDEQHRFGVKQREQLLKSRDDGQYPHYLMMSATPIPHTLTTIIFGDMSVSFIRELPPHRIPIKSHYVPKEKREDCFNWIKEKIINSNMNEQAFIIFPLIEESELLDVKAAVSEYEKLQKGVFKNLKVGILHGRMKPKEKEDTLREFKEKKYNVLVSTSVIEVGIDIPDATIMVIEEAQRFGLAQLHQFRGRVGRGKLQSYCFVLSGDDAPEETSERLSYFSTHISGFDVAEYDLQKRGPGEVYGVKQSGIPQFKVASINDIQLLIESRNIVSQLNSQGVELDKVKELLFV